MARRALVVAAIVALSGSLLGVPAKAGNHKPPTTRLNVGARQQAGRLVASCWSTPDEFLCRDGIGFPTARRVPAGHRARITIFKDEWPRRLELLIWRDIDEHGAPLGDAKRIPFDVVKKREDGAVVWRVLFRLPEGVGHRYLELDANWPAGDGVWHFHVKLA